MKRNIFLLIFIAALSTLSLRSQSFAVFEDDLLDDPQLTQKAEAGIKYTLSLPDSNGRLSHGTFKKANILHVYRHPKMLR